MGRREDMNYWAQKREGSRNRNGRECKEGKYCDKEIPWEQERMMREQN